MCDVGISVAVCDLKVAGMGHIASNARWIQDKGSVRAEKLALARSEDCLAGYGATDVGLELRQGTMVRSHQTSTNGLIRFRV